MNESFGVSKKKSITVPLARNLIVSVHNQQSSLLCFSARSKSNVSMSISLVYNNPTNSGLISYLILGDCNGHGNSINDDFNTVKNLRC